MSVNGAPERELSLDEQLALRPERRLKDLPRLLVQAIALVHRAAGRQLRISVILQVLASGGLAAQILLTKSLLTRVLEGHRAGYASVVPYIAGLAATIGLVAVVNVGRGEIQRALSELVSRYSIGKVVDLSVAVDLIEFERPSFHDRQQRALFNAIGHPLQMATGVVGIIGATFSSAAIGAALLAIKPLFVLVVLVSFAPAWIVTVASGRANYDYQVDQTERDRRRFYLQMLLTSKETAKEVRAYDNELYLRDRYDRLWSDRLRDLGRLIRQRLRRGLAGAVTTAVLIGAALGLLVLFLSDRQLTLPQAGAAAGAIILLASQLQTLAVAAGSLYESSLFMRDFSDFVNTLPDVIGRRGRRPAPTAFDRITVENTSFTYPSRTSPSLSGISLEISAGEVVALVGENGSGKTTLAKLLAGLYPPSTGSIRWDGVDIQSMVPEELRSRVAVVFQDFVRYHLTAFENISLGNWRHAEDRDRVERAAEIADAHGFISQLPMGYDTLLGPEFFGGSDLSGGQWQRVALARAFIRDPRLIILDEPTAALDPKAEAELFGRARELFEGRAVVLISHRFASVRLADRIIVLDGGAIVETGSHAELLASGGLYARMFALQAAAFGL